MIKMKAKDWIDEKNRLDQAEEELRSKRPEAILDGIEITLTSSGHLCITDDHVCIELTCAQVEKLTKWLLDNGYAGFRKEG